MSAREALLALPLSPHDALWEVCAALADGTPHGARHALCAVGALHEALALALWERDDGGACHPANVALLATWRAALAADAAVVALPKGEREALLALAAEALPPDGGQRCPACVRRLGWHALEARTERPPHEDAPLEAL